MLVRDGQEGERKAGSTSDVLVETVRDDDHADDEQAPAQCYEKMTGREHGDPESQATCEQVLHEVCGRSRIA